MNKHQNNVLGFGTYLHIIELPIVALKSKFQKGKDKEFNGQLESPHKMNDDDLKSALTIMDGNSAAITHFTHMLNWPIEKLFPVLDIFRMAVKNESIFSSFDFSHSSIIDKTLKSAIVSLPANQLMGMRLLCNMQFHETGKLYVQQNLAEFIDCLEKVSNGNGNLQIEVSAFHQNSSIKLECGSQESCISLIKLIVFLKESLVSNKSLPFEKLSEISELLDKIV